MAGYEKQPTDLSRMRGGCHSACHNAETTRANERLGGFQFPRRPVRTRKCGAVTVAAIKFGPRQLSKPWTRLVELQAARPMQTVGPCVYQPILSIMPSALQYVPGIGSSMALEIGGSVESCTQDSADLGTY
jgi:hypothetical protein